MSQTSKLSSYRWVIEALLLLLLTAQSFAWLAPAPILQEIRNGLGISLSSAGLIISIIALCIGIFSLLGAVVAERIGPLRALVIGIWLMAIGQVASGYAPNFAALLACRVLEGVGYGLVIAPPGTLVMQWFGAGEWPYINMVNFSFGYVGLTAVFRATPALFAAVGGSWQMTLLWYGVGSAGVALLWTILGREHRTEISIPTPGAIEAPAERGSALMEVAKMRNVLLIAAGLFGGMWVFQIYTAFLPEFFRTYRGMSMAEASLMTQVLPFTGLFAALGGGIGTGMSGLRKPFTWPIAFATLIGCAGVMMFPNPTWIRLSLVLVGIGSAGSLAAITTLLMELPGMNPTRVGAALGFVWAIGYFGAFLSPYLGGALAAHIGLRTVMLGFLIFQFLPIVTMYFLPETGPGRPRYEIETASASPVISREQLAEGSAKQAAP
jgi:CP family cyanate transporter-like MFS transporter